eukprot:scaffold14727_cov65-Phaeocystis_antarctica.AAC.2
MRLEATGVKCTALVRRVRNVPLKRRPVTPSILWQTDCTTSVAAAVEETVTPTERPTSWNAGCPAVACWGGRLSFRSVMRSTQRVCGSDSSTTADAGVERRSFVWASMRTGLHAQPAIHWTWATADVKSDSTYSRTTVAMSPATHAARLSFAPTSTVRSASCEVDTSRRLPLNVRYSQLLISLGITSGNTPTRRSEEARPAAGGGSNAMQCRPYGWPARRLRASGGGSRGRTCANGVSVFGPDRLACCRQRACAVPSACSSIALRKLPPSGEGWQLSAKSARGSKLPGGLSSLYTAVVFVASAPVYSPRYSSR